MRTRTRVLVGFLGVHLALSVATGWLAWRWLDRSVRGQAESRAEEIGKAIAGHPLSQGAKAELAALSGYQYRELPGPQPVRPGTVQVPVPGGSSVIEVEYRTSEHERAEHEVIVGTLRLVAAGSVAFGLVALWLSRQLARPLEELANAARAIGAGNLEAAVPAIGSGEVRSLAIELEQMRARLRELDLANRRAERLRTLGTFTATIAHEVRNPLSAVKLTVQMLAKRLPQEAALPLVTDELERLDLIVDELLAFSKGMSARRERCDLRATIETVVRLLARQAEHAGVTVVVEGNATVSADPARMRQLVMNLLLNAIQAQHGGGAVRIVIAGDGFAVEDEGPGVDPSRVPQLFEAFASGRAEGTGLGLHLARAIAEAHDASLRYEARQPRGARFVFSGLRPA